MSLQQRFEEYQFNVETLEMLQSFNTPQDEILSEMSQLGFTQGMITLLSDRLYNSIFLRLRLCVERNVNENQIRTSFSRFPQVSELLDYFFQNVEQTIQPPVKETKKVTKQPVVQETAPEEIEETAPEEIEESAAEESGDEENNYFESFFTECVRQTEDALDSVKSSDFYSAFTSWWGDNYDDDVPDKKELKSFLKEKLGKDKKGTWTNVALA